jgi:uncharacterized protein YdeI (YjbR/CyaY-like superfamily)
MPLQERSPTEKRPSVSGHASVEFFRSASEFREWLRRNHAKEKAVLVGFHKKKTVRPGMTYPEALDLALGFGWIDGVRKSIDPNSYLIRFSPRNPNSIWRAVNIKRVGELTQLGQMHPAGLKAFAQRLPENQERYSYEKGERTFGEDYVTRFQANKKAWHQSPLESFHLPSTRTSRGTGCGCGYVALRSFVSTPICHLS